MSIQIEKQGNSIRYVIHPNVERTEKGKSLIAFPKDYTVIDIETSGLDIEYNSIIEVAAVRVRGGEVQDKFSSLIKPIKWYYLSDDSEEYADYEFVPLEKYEGYYYIDEYITKLTGITNEMLEDAPIASEVLPEFFKFIGDDLLIGHNINFDINFLYEAIYTVTGQTLKNDFIDTMRISRKLFPSSEHHRACDLAYNCGVPYKDAHRSLNDSMITYASFEKMREIVKSTFDTQEDFINLFKPKGKGGRKIDCFSIVSENVDFDEDHPFYHKMVVFTGALHCIIRKDAMQSVVNVGGYISNNITKNTNYLVVGSFDYIKSVKGNKSSKMKKAEKMCLDGLDIKIISENTFLEMLENK